MNTKPKHTSEPWTADGATVRAADYRILADMRVRSRPFHANAERIVACVNALEGVANPAAVRELTEAAEECIFTGGDERALSKLRLALAALKGEQE